MPAYNGAEMSTAPALTGCSERAGVEVGGEYPLPRKQRGPNHFRQQDSQGRRTDQQSQSSATIYAATYSGVPVYEMMSRGVAVMRRKADSYLNATQILKVAGIEKGRRTKILEREILQGEHEKVQGGYGKYQGTWVPYQRGVELAEQYAVDHCLRPLLQYNPFADGSVIDNTPTKDQLKSKETTQYPFDETVAAANINTAGHGNRKRRRTEDGPSGGRLGFSGSPPPATSVALVPHDGTRISVPPPTQPSRNADKHRAMLMAIFLNEDPNQIPSMLVGSAMPPDLDIDMVIDDQGHTVVHWAAALSRMNVLQLLIERGADVNRVNYVGETALGRAVLVTNNYDTQAFPRLLKMLRASIPVCDKKNRTVLHHIVLTAGIKGRATSANYYAECLLDWIRHNDGNFSEIIDIQDKNGDTALNIAARIGNQSLIDKLVDVGASRFVENKVGLKPEDFGVEGKPGDPDTMMKVEKKDLDDKENISDIRVSGTNSSVNKRGRELIDAVQAVIVDVEKRYEEVLSSRKEALSKTQQNLRVSTRELAVLRREIAALRAKHDAFADSRHKKAALEQAVEEEEEETRQLLTAGNIPEEILRMDMLAPDAAERLLSCAVSSAVSTSLPVTVVEGAPVESAATSSPLPQPTGDQNLVNEVRALRARVDAYQHNSAELRSQISRLQNSAVEREMHCKVLIATCCNVPLEAVDSLLAPLMQAVDADGADIDLSRVAGFMSCIKQQEGMQILSQQ